jgi:hypothetical protein
MATFNFDGQLAAVIKIKDKPYTLVSDMTVGTATTKVKMKYHATTLDDAISLGKLGEVENGVYKATALVSEIAAALHIDQKLTAAKWTELADQARALPIFGPVFSNFLDTEVRITDLALELDADSGKGKATLGVAFICSGASLIGITLQSIGMLLSFDCDHV